MSIKNKSVIVLALFVITVLVGVVLIVMSSRSPQETEVPQEQRKPVGAEPGGLVLNSAECANRGGRVADTTKGEKCNEYEEAISAVTGFIAPGLCCVASGETRLDEVSARDIAQNTQECTAEGAVADFETYNPNSKTWWFSILSPRSDCRPACVVFDETGETEVNWRCGGLLLPEEEMSEGFFDQCVEMGGEWIPEASECEYISQEDCTMLGGEFNECGSACRNDPEAQMCTMQCVPYCSL